MKKCLLVGLLFTMSILVIGQEPFDRFDFLIGNWQGVETGVAGDGIGFRTYSYELNKNYILEKNQSTFPITEKKPKGEVHRDFGIMSYNANDSAFVFRQFHVEGFTIVYLLDEKLSTDTNFVFISREIENSPGNWKAKSSIAKISDTEFIETFDIATDGKIFKPFLKNHWYKVK